MADPLAVFDPHYAPPEAPALKAVPPSDTGEDEPILDIVCLGVLVQRFLHRVGES